MGEGVGNKGMGNSSLPVMEFEPTNPSKKTDHLPLDRRFGGLYKRKVYLQEIINFPVRFVIT